ncbi:MAG: hypothetical protein BIFFINMI_01099 [Phycisphaerae bacterium]|nr:hypothetical protein [Phycisphaerae bacterium]
MTRLWTVTLLCILSANLQAAEPTTAPDGQAAKPAFTPNPKLANLADNTVIDLGPFTWEKPAGEGGGGAPTDYSGMVYDPHNNRILLFGGGHATTWTDAIYAFDFKDLTWKSLYTPTPARFYTKENMDRGFWKAGGAGNYPRPVGRHTYDLLVVPDDRAELLLLRDGTGPSGAAPGFGYIGGAGGAYDFTSGKWKMLPRIPFGGYGATAEYDPVSKKVVGVAGQKVFLFDPDTGESKAILHDIMDKYKVSSYSGTLVYFPPDGRMYGIPSSKKVCALELDRKDFSKSKIANVEVSGECPPSECAFACDSHNSVIGGGVLQNRFYVFDPAAKTWTSQEIKGGQPGTMTFHCLVYSPVDNVYIFIAGRHTWAYRWKR